MANDIDKARAWLVANGADAVAALDGSLELIQQLRPTAVYKSTSIAALLTADPMVARQVADAAGLAGIAGRRGVDAEKVLEGAAVLVKLGAALLALL